VSGQLNSEPGAWIAVRQTLILTVGDGLPERQAFIDHIGKVGGLLGRGGQAHPTTAADLLCPGQPQQLLQQVLEAVQFRGHRTVGRPAFLGHIVFQVVRAKPHGGKGIAQLVRCVGDEAALPVQ
jgi:hypothetical protein